MGNGATLFGTIPVRSTADLSMAIRAGALDKVDLALLRGAWGKQVSQDAALRAAFDAIDLDPSAQEALATLLQDPARSAYWSIARGELGHLKRFAPAEVVSSELAVALERRSNSGSPAYAGVSFLAGNSSPSKTVRPGLRLESAVTTAPILLPAGIQIREGVELPNENGKRGTIIEWGGTATFEELYKVLTQILKPVWFTSSVGLEESVAMEEDTTRLVLPEDFARRILHWGYRQHFKVYQERARHYELLMKHQRGEALSTGENTFLADLSARIERKGKASATVLRFLTYIGSLSVRSTDRNYLQTTVANVVHDVKNVTYAWKSLLMDVQESIAKPPSPPAGSLADMVAYVRDLHKSDLHLVEAELKVDDATKALLSQHVLAENIDLIIDISNALDNLIGNAIKYRDKHLVITIQAVRLSHGSIQITVSDNGSGISHHHLVRVAMPQWREQSADRVGFLPEVSGEGRGLANTVAGLARHGSFLSVRSDENEGASFRFVLPANHLRKNGKPVGTEEGAQSDMAEALAQGLRAKDYQDAYLIPSVLMHGDILQRVVKLAEGGNMNAALNLRGVVRNSDYKNQEAENAFLRLRVTNLAKEWSPPDCFVFINTGSLHAVLELFKRWPEHFSRYVASDNVRPPLRLLQAAENNNPKGTARLAVLLLAAGGNQSSLDWIRAKDGYHWMRDVSMTPAQAQLLRQLR